MTSTDLFRRGANEWRRLAIRARNADDKVFWLGLVECWEAARQRCSRQVLARDFDPPSRSTAPYRTKKANPPKSKKTADRGIKGRCQDWRYESSRN
jgi:hypothetical protein